MTPADASAPSYRTQLAGNLSALMNLWWSPVFHAGMVRAAGGEVGVTEARLLWELGYLRSARPGELAARMEIGAPSITKAIAKLRSRGLVTQQVVADDRRGRVVALTEEGQQVTHRLYDVGDSLVERIVARWDPERVAEFTQMMDAFVAGAIARGSETGDEQVAPTQTT